MAHGGHVRGPGPWDTARSSSAPSARGCPTTSSRAATRSATIPLEPGARVAQRGSGRRDRAVRSTTASAEHGDRGRGDAPTATTCGRSIRGRRGPARGRASFSTFSPSTRAEDAPREDRAKRQRIAGSDVARLHADRAARRRDVGVLGTRLEPDDRVPARHARQLQRRARACPPRPASRSPRRGTCRSTTSVYAVPKSASR